MRVALLGFGLIGGSIARALRAAGPDWSVAAWSPSGAGPDAAARDGVIDAAATTMAIAIDGADLVVLAVPPLACLALLDALGGPLRGSLAGHAVVTDVASTKEQIVGRAAAVRLPFVGGHPMAGRETTGYASADPDLFRDRPWVLVSDDPDRRARVESLVLACGAVPEVLTAAAHDQAVAAISHLPLVLAVALVEAIGGPAGGPARADWPLNATLGAGGWQSMTRLARGDPEMGTGILATNAAPVADRLRELRVVLDSWLAGLEAPGGPDSVELGARLRSARARLDETS
jgi:prephenate dehydrogenase